MSPESLNPTNGNQATSNPQTAPAPAASNAEDFQSTASDEVLRQQQAESLSVESTGQPAEGQSTSAPTDGFSTSWLIGLFVIAAVVGYFLAKLLKEASADVGQGRSVAVAAPTKKKTTATAAKKTAAKPKKKPAAKKRRKAAAKKKR